MTLDEIARVCQQRSERDPEQDRGFAYGYVARYLRERPQITLVQLARELEQWRDVHEQSAGRLRSKAPHLCTSYEQQAAVYQEVLSWVKGETSMEREPQGAEGSDAAL